MKICFITPPLSKQIGGIENAVEGLREALLAQGVEVVQGFNPDDPTAVHHFHGLWDPSHARMASRLRKQGRRYVVSPHGMLEPWAFRHRRWKKVPYFWLIERRFLVGASALFVTSEMEREHLLRVVRHSRVEVLPLGCRDPQAPAREQARKSLGWSPDQKVMLFLSRVDTKKGLHMLFDAIEKLPKVVRLWRLVIVGDGPKDYVAELKRQQQRLGTSLPEIDWVGPVWGDARWPYIQGADLFVLPTHSENFGIAVLEALHAGTPVLTTTGTPWRDHSQTEGIFICDPTVTSIGQCLETAASRLATGWCESDREGLAEWAQTHFAWSNLVKEYQRAYASLADR